MIENQAQTVGGVRSKDSTFIELLIGVRHYSKVFTEIIMDVTCTLHRSYVYVKRNLFIA